VCNEFWALIS